MRTVLETVALEVHRRHGRSVTRNLPLRDKNNTRNSLHHVMACTFG